jgi:peptidoglycan hydrolase CwlO-like protein
VSPSIIALFIYTCNTMNPDYEPIFDLSRQKCECVRLNNTNNKAAGLLDCKVLKDSMSFIKYFGHASVYPTNRFCPYCDYVNRQESQAAFDAERNRIQKEKQDCQTKIKKLKEEIQRTQHEIDEIKRRPVEK